MQAAADKVPEPLSKEKEQQETILKSELVEEKQLLPQKEEPAVEEPPPEVEADQQTVEDLEELAGLAEEDLFVPPVQAPIEGDEIVEIETIESAIPLKRITKEEVREKFSSIVKNFKTDLNTRSKSVDQKARDRIKEENSQTRIKKVHSIVSDNQEMFRKQQIAAKWKHFPMNRAMRRSYLLKVNETIKAHWNLPLEMDPSLQILVKISISKTGKILTYEFVESSENRFFNHSVLQVFKNLDQLPPLPEEFSGESTEIGLRFTSKQFNDE